MPVRLPGEGAGSIAEVAGVSTVRKRIRQNWLQMVYKYRAYMPDIPNFVWEHVSAQRVVWNQLCDAFDGRLEEWTEIKENVDKEEKAEFWDAFWNECSRVVGESDLNWEAGPDVLDRFRTAAVAFFKSPERGRPQRRKSLTRQIRLIHRYTGGGVPVDRLFGTRAWRFSILEAPPEDAYDDNSRESRRRRVVPARFGIDGQTFDFRVRLHRQMPVDAVVKRVAWLGEWQPRPWNDEYWVWHLAIWLEIPPEAFVITPDGQTQAGVDLGWRKFDDYLRIGYICDSAGRNVELRLPLEMSSFQTRRHSLPSSWEDKREMDAQISAQVDVTKVTIKPLLQAADLPADIRRSVGQLQKMRQGGLKKLRVMLAGLYETEYWSSEVEEVIQVLDDWHAMDSRLSYQVNQLSRRLVRRREWLYGNLAKWLWETYGMVVWEGDLDVKVMAEDADKEPALKAANRYRQIAAIGELRRFIERAAIKYGGELVDGEAAGTTNKCSVCGALVLTGPARMLICANGHLQDQDYNAAKNLLSRINGDLGRSEGLRKAGELEIPDELEGIVVVRSKPTGEHVDT